MLKDQIKAAPSSPGVYIFRKKTIPIYIGKATNIKARLLSHWNNAKLDKKEAALIGEADTIEHYLTESDFRALVLEARLINQYKPKYNVRNRDDKSYLYLKIIVKDRYPKVYPVRKNEIIDDQSLYFGPYSGQRVVLYLIRVLRKIFPFCTQKKITLRRCFYSKIGLCSPCPNEISQLKDVKERGKLTGIYRSNIRRLIKLLEGKIEPLINQLNKQLDLLTKNQLYEQALLIRDQIFRLEYLSKNQSFNFNEDDYIVDNQKAVNDLNQLLGKFFPLLNPLKKIEAIDISNFTTKAAVGSLVVFMNGIPDKAQYRRFKIKDIFFRSDFERMTEVINRRFKNNWSNPDLLVVDGGRPQVRMAVTLIKLANRNIPIIGIAKRPDRLIIGNNELSMIRPSVNHLGFNLIRQIRDESHRFAKKYHLLLRKKAQSF